MSISQPHKSSPDHATTTRAKLIINPQAWHGSEYENIAEHICDLLAQRGIQAEAEHTTPTEHGTSQAKAAAAAGFGLVIAAGGDGTIQDVAKGLIGTKATLGIIPCGTMNNVAKSLYIPEDLEAACELIATGPHKAIDVGMINGQPFMEVVSIGFEAPLFGLGERTRHRGIFGALQAAAGVLRLLWRIQPYSFALEIDGRRKMVRAQQVTICNTPRYGLGFVVAPDARVDDGYLDIVISRHARRWDLIRHYWSIMHGRRELDTRVQIRRAKRILIESKHLLPVAADGEESGTLPVRVNVAARKLRVVLGQAPTTPEPSPSPIIEILRTMSPKDTDRSPHVLNDAQSARRMSQISSWYWIVTASAGVLVWLAHRLGIWRQLPAPKAKAGSQSQQQRHRAELVLVPLGLAAIFWRLRLRFESLAFLLTGAMGSVVTPLWRWVAQRQPDVVEPDDSTMYAVASMGVLTAGLWATRKPTVRTGIFTAFLAGLGAWFSFMERRSAATPDRQRDSVALGAGLGALWLGVMLSLLAWLRQGILHITGSETITPHKGTSPAVAPASDLQTAGTNLAAPVAMQTELERGDILLFGPDGTLGAQAIEFLTRSHYHHSALYDGDGMVIEAMPEGVRRSALGTRRITGIRPPIPAEKRTAVADWARSHIGDKYDTRGLLLIAFDRLFPGLRLGGPPVHRFSCAVFIADGYMQEGYDLLPGERWEDLVPGDFMALMDTPPKPVQ
jgi:diacylglycerol kinase (ATP)